MKYHSRQLESIFCQRLKQFPVVGVTGPRQAGKTTMINHLNLQGYQYISMDDFDHFTLFEDDPGAFMQLYSGPVVIDEAQKAPDLFRMIKHRVDQDRSQMGQVILTGSSQFLLMEAITESLAGRIGMLELLPFQYAECPPASLSQRIVQGSFPEVVDADPDRRHAWYQNYMMTYLERDVRSLANVGDLHDFRRFMQWLAARTSQVLHLSGFANDLGVSVPTIKRWLSLLEASYVVFCVPAYHGTLSKRTIKQPKVYFYDTGLACFLSGITRVSLYERGPMVGPLFENYVASEIKKRLCHMGLSHQLYHYRTQDGLACDLVIDEGQRRHWLEVKHSHSFKARMMQVVKRMAGHHEGDLATLVYQGKDMVFSQREQARSVGSFLSDAM